MINFFPNGKKPNHKKPITSTISRSLHLPSCYVQKYLRKNVKILLWEKEDDLIKNKGKAGALCLQYQKWIVLSFTPLSVISRH